ncbi:MAG: hypothetical protein JST65_10650, partial [Acidobacteria bacterium]|nr:hypothetical protein [Acidobacteriota bacterium]
SGFSKNRFYALYDSAMLGITNVSKMPLRLFTFFGFACAGLSVLASLGFLIYKLVYWDWFSVGMAPILIGFFFLTSVQLIFVGLLSEYVAAIHTQVMKRPLTVEAERINFDKPSDSIAAMHAAVSADRGPAVVVTADAANVR